MISASRARFVFLGLSLAFASQSHAVPAERSVSTSRQFIVYGRDLRVRGVICEVAEQTKRNLLRLLDRRDDWTTPIVINAQLPQANLPETPRTALHFSQTGFGLKLQLDLVLAADLHPSQVRRELLRAILLEEIYRSEPKVPAGTAYVSPPEWLLDGLLAQQSELEPRAALTDLLAAPVAAQKILPLEKFLRQRPALLDAPGRSLYRAYSFAFVDLFLHAPDGRHRLGNFITSLSSASNDPIADLRSHFPELGSDEKSWASHVVRLSTGRPHQLLGAAETERMLEEILRLKISDAGAEQNYSLDEFPRFPRNASATVALAQARRALSALALRANPICRSIVLEYAEIATRLARGKTKGLSERLARVRAACQRLAAQMEGIEDYMNWFEVTKSRGPSGAFADYIRAAELAAHPEQTRRDPISVYLDALESQFQN
ncbi:MAG TPA: hypothetical protein VN921_04840 [Chthoniobacterales bacterium]|nr:hypothetical protein [Chthoniobacterales bacterium]